MAYQVVWTKDTEDDLFEIIKYMKENWSQQSAERFISQTKELRNYLNFLHSVEVHRC